MVISYFLFKNGLNEFQFKCMYQIKNKNNKKQ